MPIYEYVCEECENEFELLVRGSEPPACTRCGSPQLRKLLSVPAAHSTTDNVGPCGMPVSEACGRGGCGLPQCQM